MITLFKRYRGIFIVYGIPLTLLFIYMFLSVRSDPYITIKMQAPLLLIVGAFIVSASVVILLSEYVYRHGIPVNARHFFLFGPLFVLAVPFLLAILQAPTSTGEFSLNTFGQFILVYFFEILLLFGLLFLFPIGCALLGIVTRSLSLKREEQNGVLLGSLLLYTVIALIIVIVSALVFSNIMDGNWEIFLALFFPFVGFPAVAIGFTCAASIKTNPDTTVDHFPTLTSFFNKYLGKYIFISVILLIFTFGFLYYASMVNSSFFDLLRTLRFSWFSLFA